MDYVNKSLIFVFFLCHLSNSIDTMIVLIMVKLSAEDSLKIDVKLDITLPTDSKLIQEAKKLEWTSDLPELDQVLNTILLSNINYH